jgi:hypothetical protein
VGRGDTKVVVIGDLHFCVLKKDYDQKLLDEGTDFQTVVLDAKNSHPIFVSTVNFIGGNYMEPWWSI